MPPPAQTEQAIPSGILRTTRDISQKAGAKLINVMPG